MSMEIQVFSDRRLVAIEEWQRAIEAERYPLRLATDLCLATAEGFLPAQLNGKDAGFECFHDNAAEAMKLLGEQKFDRPWQFALGLRWIGSSMEELLSAWMAATAYAAAAEGVIFDHEEGRVFMPEEARNTVRNIERDIPLMDVMEVEFAKRYRPSGS